jgi:hypothetical protein
VGIAPYAAFLRDLQWQCILGKIVLLENATDLFLSVFKITKNFWKINSTIQDPIRFYKAYYIKHFLSVLESRNQTKSVHFQYDFSIFLPL